MWRTTLNPGHETILLARPSPLPFAGLNRCPPAPALVRSGISIGIPGWGGSPLRLVIRSQDFGQPGVQDDEDQRMIVPARSSAEMAERHGALDDDDGRPRADLYGILSTRDEDLRKWTVGDWTYPTADADSDTAPWLPDAMA